MPLLSHCQRVTLEMESNPQTSAAVKYLGCFIGVGLFDASSRAKSLANFLRSCEVTFTVMLAPELISFVKSMIISLVRIMDKITLLNMLKWNSTM